ncbi:DNA polymerase III epsilon subunit-like protein [Arthrobacter sp. UYP6]|uniref:exonuclease domain-containing protein n=1 Tax=Arthrobacter sp. UYP6 TaxID=1756378 RepID=UPI00339104B8
MTLNFTAIDFETANGSRASACAMGMVKVRNGHIVERGHWFLRPTDGGGFQQRNIEVHGITEAMVAGAPTWAHIHSEVAAFIGDDAVIAHNAAFDLDVFRKTSEAAGIASTPYRSGCSVKLAQGMLPLENHKLPTVHAALGFGAFTHHDGLADAEACANITITLAAREGLTDIDAVLKVCGLKGPSGATGASAAQSPAAMRAQRFAPRPTLTLDEPVAAMSAKMSGHMVSFTGDFSVERPVLQQMVREHGGELNNHAPTRTTTLLVVGDWEPEMLRPGAVVSRSVQKAQDLRAKGQALEIIGEAALWQLVDTDPAAAAVAAGGAVLLPSAYEPLSLADTAPALPKRRDVKGMGTVLAQMGPADLAAATFKSDHYGVFRVSGTAFKSPVLGVRMLGHRSIENNAKPERDIHSLAVLQDEDAAFVAVLTAHVPDPESTDALLGSVRHGDVVTAVFDALGGPFVVQGVAVYAPVAEMFMLGSMILARHGRSGTKLSWLQSVIPRADHTLAVPEQISAWDFYESSAD